MASFFYEGRKITTIIIDQGLVPRAGTIPIFYFNFKKRTEQQPERVTAIYNQLGVLQ